MVIQEKSETWYMIFRQVVEHTKAMTCVFSVQKRPDGRYGDIRIITGTRAYTDSIEQPMGDVHVRSALRKSDENMYEDKRQYYRIHPGTGRG